MQQLQQCVIPTFNTGWSRLVALFCYLRTISEAFSKAIVRLPGTNANDSIAYMTLARQHHGCCAGQGSLNKKMPVSSLPCAEADAQSATHPPSMQ